MDRSERTLAIINTFTAVCFSLFAAHAHVRLHYRMKINLRRFPLCVEFYLRNRVMRKRVVELFFPLLQCIVIVPLVQMLCVWKIHLRDENLKHGFVLTTSWQSSLVFSGVCVILSEIRSNYATYFAHIATASQMCIAWFFLFDSALGGHASGDIAVSALMIIVCAMQLLHPPRKLKSYEDYQDMNGIRSYAADEWRASRDVENSLRRDILNVNNGRVSFAYEGESRHGSVRKIRGWARRATQRVRTLNGRFRRDDKKGDNGAESKGKPPTPMFTIEDSDDVNAYFDNPAINAHIEKHFGHIKPFGDPDQLPGISESSEEEKIVVAGNGEILDAHPTKHAAENNETK